MCPQVRKAVPLPAAATTAAAAAAALPAAEGPPSLQATWLFRIYIPGCIREREGSSGTPIQSRLRDNFIIELVGVRRGPTDAQASLRAGISRLVFAQCPCDPCMRLKGALL